MKIFNALKFLRNALILMTSFAALSPLALADSLDEKLPVQTLFELVSKLDTSDHSNDPLGVFRVSIDVRSCSRVVYPGAMASCELFDSQIVQAEDGEVLFSAIREALGLVQDGSLGAARVPAASVSCSSVVSPRALPTCTVEELLPLGGGNSSIGGITQEQM